MDTEQLSLFSLKPIPQGRRELDFYETPDWMPRTVLEYVGNFGGTVLEPCVGDWAIANVLAEYGVQLVTNDIDPLRQADFHLDASKSESWEKFPVVDWIVTNPPYNQGFDIIRHARDYAKVGIIMFPRMSFFEPWKRRGGWLERYPATLVVSLPRYQFKRNDKGKWAYDNAAVWGGVWQKDGTVYQPSFRVRSPKSIKGFYKNPDDGRKLKLKQ
jgi:hypothetical protein